MVNVNVNAMITNTLLQLTPSALTYNQGSLRINQHRKLMQLLQVAGAQCLSVV